MTKRTKEQDTDRPVRSCESCHAQIPVSAAITFEGADYARYFCSQACYDKWRAENPPTEKGEQ